MMAIVGGRRRRSPAGRGSNGLVLSRDREGAVGAQTLATLCLVGLERAPGVLRPQP